VPEVVCPPWIASVSLDPLALGAVDRSALEELTTLEIVSPNGIPVPVTTAPTSALVKLPDVRVIAGLLLVLTFPVTFRCEVMAQAFAPLLQNSVSGDGNGCSVLLRPVATAFTVPVSEL
jgi:hypothetical protein